ncbi:ATP-binding protein [Suipraeoptans intestinalis]|uniref:ATP-binding protein n=1 Tax=Suipraeoptans intestinalis TaxID=2606628 RepID=UPI0023F10732|nr:ATP-binding protein [Suipraeoptans intestinalis]MDD7769453.1 ATP-binding protein [Suipraeoptans intestinalis]MDY3122518.1 ATP-binding protein [Suipraeoptans intestinalis]
MVNVLTGPKGTGKTQQMIALANEQAKKLNGSVVFIKKTHRDTSSVSFDIRTICMDDYPAIANIDEYIGFLYGIYSSNQDTECVFIDGILKHADISLDNMPQFVSRLNQLSKECNIEFYVSISADKAQVSGDAYADCNYLN